MFPITTVIEVVDKSPLLHLYGISKKFCTFDLYMTTYYLTQDFPCWSVPTILVLNHYMVLYCTDSQYAELYDAEPWYFNIVVMDN